MSDPNLTQGSAVLASPDVDALAGIHVEPDDVPTRLLAWLGVGITVVVVGLVLFVYVLFRFTVAAELKAKGYDVDYSVPAEEAAQ